MSRALIQETLRAIRGSLGRFLAIMGIVALGCGFFVAAVISAFTTLNNPFFVTMKEGVEAQAKALGLKVKI